MVLHIWRLMSPYLPLVFSRLLDQSAFLERKCRERANYANIPRSIRVIRPLAFFALKFY
jgi:hypothetical protein